MVRHLRITPVSEEMVLNYVAERELGCHARTERGGGATGDWPPPIPRMATPPTPRHKILLHAASTVKTFL